MTDNSASQPPAPLSEFERVAREHKEALRAAGGDSLFIAEGLAWVARQLEGRAAGTPPANRDLTPFERVAEEAKRFLRNNAGQPHTAHGWHCWPVKDVDDA